MANARQLVLAIADPALRSMLAAQLGMAGETPIATGDHLDPKLGEAIRATALLIIEDTLIASVAGDWGETLRNQCWSGQVIIIADPLPPANLPHDPRVAIVGPQNVGVSVLALIDLERSRTAESLNSL